MRGGSSVEGRGHFAPKLSISSSFRFAFSLPRFRFEMLEYLLCKTELLRRLAALSVYLTFLRLDSLRSSRSLLPFFAFESSWLSIVLFSYVSISTQSIAISVISRVVRWEFRALSLCFCDEIDHPLELFSFPWQFSNQLGQSLHAI